MLKDDFWREERRRQCLIGFRYLDSISWRILGREGGCANIEKKSLEAGHAGVEFSRSMTGMSNQTWTLQKF